MTPRPETPNRVARTLAIQGWAGLAAWMTFGLLIEGLIGFRSPVYLQDPLRRELFQLAHAHGAVFSVVLLVAGLYLQKDLIGPPGAAVLSLQIGTVLMPVGFLLGGVWHYGNDPGLGVFLAPVGGVMIIFGVIAIAISSFGGRSAAGEDSGQKEPENK